MSNSRISRVTRSLPGRRQIVAGVLGVAALGLTLGLIPSRAADTTVSSPQTGWPFFAFDNGVGRDKGWNPEQQATLTARLGYDGIGYTRVENLDARFAACKAHHQRVFSFYEGFTLGADPPVAARVLESLPRLRDTRAILWFHVHGRATEAEAVSALRRFADQARRHGVRVAIYPHAGNYVATGRHALRLAKAVDRENFGITINVCHELKAGNADLAALARDAGRHLFLVSINGADRLDDPAARRDWARLIQPLGEGDFDLGPLMRQLHASGYKGPIGLQCYQVRGGIEEGLSKSIGAWRELAADALGEINASSDADK